MALGIVDAASTFSDDMSRGQVVVESDNGVGNFAKAFDELNTLDARNMAMRFASQRGMGAVRINGNVDGPYPINDEGVPLDEIKDAAGKPLPQTHARMQPARYRITVPVCRPIG